MNSENHLDTNIISSSSLFTNQELDLLQQLDDNVSINIKPTEDLTKETFVEFRNGQYGYYAAHNQEFTNDDFLSDDIRVVNEQDIKNNDWKMCPTCHEKLQNLSIATSECPKCGAEVINASEDQELKKSGGGGFSGIVQSNYLNYDSKAHIKRKIVSELKQKSYNSDKHMIPAYIIEIAVEKFLIISKKKIHRGSVQRGLKVMLIKYTLDENNISKSTKVIGKIYNLDDKQLSAADALLRNYVAQGVIEINCLNVDRTAGFINNYINIFKIDTKYVSFINEIINEADKAGVHLSNNFKPSTKATGSFLLFLYSFSSIQVKSADVIKESGLTKSTVTRYFNLLLNNIALLKPVYNRWGIRPPISLEKKNINKTIMPPPYVIFKLEPLTVDGAGVIQD